LRLNDSRRVQRRSELHREVSCDTIFGGYQARLPASSTASPRMPLRPWLVAFIHQSSPSSHRAPIHPLSDQEDTRAIGKQEWTKETHLPDAYDAHTWAAPSRTRASRLDTSWPACALLLCPRSTAWKIFRLAAVLSVWLSSSDKQLVATKFKRIAEAANKEQKYLRDYPETFCEAFVKRRGIEPSAETKGLLSRLSKQDRVVGIKKGSKIPPKRRRLPDMKGLSV
jgi:hypothetical protein